MLGVLVVALLFSLCDAQIPMQCQQALEQSQRVALHDANFCTRLVQKRLNERFGASLLVDGRFGSETEAAVRAFQRQQSREETGHVAAGDMAILFPAPSEL